MTATTITGVRLIDDVRTSVRFARGTVIAVGSGPESGDEVVDGAGATLLPGLVDSHVHLLPGAPQQAATFGVTTLLDMFSPPELAARLRAGEGAAVRSSGIGATAPGGHPDLMYGPFPTVAGPGDAARFVADRVADGADHLKIILEPGDVRRFPMPALDTPTAAALVRAGHEHGLVVVAHATSVGTYEQAIAAGVDVVTHLPVNEVLPPAVIDALAAAGTAVCPTLSVAETAFGGPGGRALADDAALRSRLGPRWRARLAAPAHGPADPVVLEVALRSVAQLAAAGVPLLAGTDAPNPGTTFGASLHRELELLVRAGLPPVAALRTATTVPAKVFGLTAAIAPGAPADLVLVDADPTSDITACRRTRRVWRDGLPVDLDAFVDSPTEDEQLASLDAHVARLFARIGERWPGAFGGDEPPRIE